MPAAHEDEQLREWLTQLRNRTGMSQVQAAEAIGVSPREIRRWENENAPGSLNLLRLLNTYGVVFSEPPPDTIPGSVNAELAAVKDRLAQIDERLGLEDQRQPISTIMYRIEQLVTRLEDPAGVPASDLEEVAGGLRRLCEGMLQVAEALDARRRALDGGA